MCSTHGKTLANGDVDQVGRQVGVGAQALRDCRADVGLQRRLKPTEGYWQDQSSAQLAPAARHPSCSQHPVSRRSHSSLASWLCSSSSAPVAADVTSGRIVNDGQQVAACVKQS